MNKAQRFAVSVHIAEIETLRKRYKKRVVKAPESQAQTVGPPLIKIEKRKKKKTQKVYGWTVT